MFPEGTGEQTGFAHTTQLVEHHQTISPLTAVRKDWIKGSETQMSMQFRDNLVAEMDELVWNFRSKKIMKVETLFQILQVIWQADISESIKHAALEQYTTHLDLIDAQGQQAEHWGEHAAGTGENECGWDNADTVDRDVPGGDLTTESKQGDAEQLLWDLQKELLRNGDIGALPVQWAQMKDQPGSMERVSPTRRREYFNPSYHGMNLKLKHNVKRSMRIEERQGRYLVYFRRTSPLPSKKFNDQQQPHKASPSLSGDKSFEGKQLTSTSSSATSTILPLLRRMWVTFEEWRSLLEGQIQHERSRQVVTGLPHGMWQPKQPHMPSHIKKMNSGNGETIWDLSSQQSKSIHTINSLPLTRPSEWELEGDKPYCSQTIPNSLISTQPSSSLMVPKQGQVDGQDLIKGNVNAQVRFAVISTFLEDVGAQPVVANTNIR
jgi:hypothetical protein